MERNATFPVISFLSSKILRKPIAHAGSITKKMILVSLGVPGRNIEGLTAISTTAVKMIALPVWMLLTDYMRRLPTTATFQVAKEILTSVQLRAQALNSITALCASYCDHTSAPVGGLVPRPMCTAPLSGTLRAADNLIVINTLEKLSTYGTALVPYTRVLWSLLTFPICTSPFCQTFTATKIVLFDSRWRYSKHFAALSTCNASALCVQPRMIAVPTAKGPIFIRDTYYKRLITVFAVRLNALQHLAAHNGLHTKLWHPRLECWLLKTKLTRMSARAKILCMKLMSQFSLQQNDYNPYRGESQIWLYPA